MNAIVECYSGSEYGEKPVAFTWQGKRYCMLEILSEGRTPLVKWFRVRTEAGGLFELLYNEAASVSSVEHEWQINKI
jgi:hypothetical protein